MADQTSASIDIAASPAEIMAVIADFERYPEWVDSMKSAEVLTRSGTAGRRRSGWCWTTAWSRTTTCWPTSGSRTMVSWQLVEGTLLKAMDGAYALKPNGASTTVTYQLTVDVNMPMIGLFKRKAEKTIIDGALKNLKKRVEG